MDDYRANLSAIARDPEQPIPARVGDLVSRMTLAEKVGQMLHEAPAIPHLGIPAYNWWNECLHGVGRAGLATVFPQAIGLAATWNTDLMHTVATAIADEARAKHHDAISQGRREAYFGLTFWTPNINIFRDPRWGRGQETYGEDPYLTAQMALTFIRGLQGDDPHYLKLVATPKHFAVHSGPEAERHHFNAEVSQRDLRETYLPAFEACIREGKAASVMGAYNRTNGEPCCASPTLLKGILRQEWGFAGYVVSDCWAIQDIYQHHQVVETEAEAAALAVNAGCDLNCGSAYPALLEAVEQGLISEAAIDQAVTRLFTARFRLGMFDPPERVAYAQIPISVNDSPAHRALALQAARESIVLLKNSGLLPFPRSYRSIAVIGPNAAETDVLLGNYNGTPASPVSILDGIHQKLGPAVDVAYARGCGLVGKDTQGFAEAVKLAEAAEVVIFVGGLSQLLEGEEGQHESVPEGEYSQGDRTDIELPAIQSQLLQAIHATGTPTVLVLVNGGPIALPWAQVHIPAIVETWYPGQAGGTAVADVLFGDYNPAGRLPVTVHGATEDLPAFEDYAMQNRTYRYFGGEVLYRFGHGLSYTRFAYRDLQLSADSIGMDDDLLVTVTVENVGDMPGDEVVQLYCSDLEASVPVPVRQLVGFQRVHLNPGESATVTLVISTQQLCITTDDGQRVLEGGEFQLGAGGRQPSAEDPPQGSDAMLFASFTLR